MLRAAPAPASQVSQTYRQAEGRANLSPWSWHVTIAYLVFMALQAIGARTVLNAALGGAKLGQTGRQAGLYYSIAAQLPGPMPSVGRMWRENGYSRRCRPTKGVRPVPAGCHEGIGIACDLSCL
jgi:hypothetical protein